MIHPVPWRECRSCGAAIADTEVAEYDEREGAYYCGCPGSERMGSTPAAHCDWGNHEVGAHLVHPVGDDERACTACIQDDHMAREAEANDNANDNQSSRGGRDLQPGVAASPARRARDAARHAAGGR